MIERDRGQLTNEHLSTYSRGGGNLMTDGPIETPETPSETPETPEAPVEQAPQATAQAPEEFPDKWKTEAREATWKTVLTKDSEGDAGDEKVKKLRKVLGSEVPAGEKIGEMERSPVRTKAKRGLERIAKANNKELEGEELKIEDKDKEKGLIEVVEMHKAILEILNQGITEETPKNAIGVLTTFLTQYEFTKDVFGGLEKPEQEEVIRGILQNPDYRKKLHDRYNTFVSKGEGVSGGEGFYGQIKEKEKSLEDAERRKRIADKLFEDALSAHNAEFVHQSKTITGGDGKEQEVKTLQGEYEANKKRIAEILTIDNVEYSHNYIAESTKEIETLEEYRRKLVERSGQGNNRAPGVSESEIGLKKEELEKTRLRLDTLRGIVTNLQGRIDNSEEYGRLVARQTEIDELRKKSSGRISQRRNESSDIAEEVSKLTIEKNELVEAAEKSGEEIADDEVNQQVLNMLNNAFVDYGRMLEEKGEVEYRKILDKEKEKAGKEGDKAKELMLGIIQTNFRKVESSSRKSFKGGFLQNKEITVPNKENIKKYMDILSGEKGARGVVEGLLEESLAEGKISQEAYDMFLKDEAKMKEFQISAVAHLIHHKIAAGGMTSQLLEDIANRNEEGFFAYVQMNKRLKEGLEASGFTDSKLKELWKKTPKKSMLLILSLLFLGVVPTAGIYLIQKKAAA